MDNLFVALFEILSFGAIVVLVVLGLGIIASMMGIFNFAQGEFVLLGAYVTYIVHSAGLPVWLGMLAAPFFVGALGLVLERTIVRRFYAAPIVAMLGTYALGLIIREIVRGLIGGLYLSVPEPLGGSVNIGTMHFSTWRLVIILITALVMVGSYLLLSRTAFGLRIRA
jgi:branched-chain amino acid transport system permease protein